tara:strand:+ start:2196 stop:2510 length:315 start_codon:yes stop_codon:yes gene_type:complete
MTKAKKIHHLVISDADWSDRYQVTLFDGQDTAIARATIYYPKDLEHGWLMELGQQLRGFNGLISERLYYSGALPVAKRAAMNFINIYKKELENKDGQSIRLVDY